MTKKKQLAYTLLVIFFAVLSVFGLSIFKHDLAKTNIKLTHASAQEPADINNDGKVDIFDLSILLSNWNKTGTNTSDINSDSTVNIFDLSILLSKWGSVVTVTPTPTPVAGGCPAYPSFPNASCTGWQHTGVTLTAYTGPTTITTAGAVIDSKDITSCIVVNANNVTIKRSRVRCIGGPESSTTYGVKIAPGISGIVLEDVEVMSTNTPSNCTLGDPNLITRPIMLDGAEGVRMTRIYAHNMRSGIWITWSNSTILEDSFITTDCNPDPHNGSGDDWQHSTAIADLGGATNVTIRHNNIDNGAENASSAMSLYPQYGQNDNFLITQNLFNSGAYYCAYLGYTPASEQPNTRFTITNNVWGTKYNQDCGASAPVVYANFDLNKFNTAYPQGWGNVWSGNTWKNGLPYNLSDL